MNLVLLLKLLHIATAFWLITGIVGRNVVLSRAAHSTEIQTVRALLPVVTIFERGMVLPGSSAVLLAGLLAAWAGGWPILGFLQGGKANWVLVSILLLLTIFPVIRFVFVPRGKIFEQTLQAAVAEGQVTPQLAAAFHDPAVRAGHIYEMVVLAIIVVLMVLKPF